MIFMVTCYHELHVTYYQMDRYTCTYAYTYMYSILEKIAYNIWLFWGGDTAHTWDYIISFQIRVCFFFCGKSLEIKQKLPKTTSLCFPGLACTWLWSSLFKVPALKPSSLAASQEALHANVLSRKKWANGAQLKTRITLVKGHLHCCQLHTIF